ncbi:FISUMP domain-containing protein [Cyclobacterium sp. 1_MG-2023]|uniref:FISUMP domain-containing protein n=1 Tax=Cyclobacterium sp. 1_MG-2023 TaxID=3062681 RepID=UPI0026E2832E|nr:FISUMP domain-containing protein [Cyclobacterium sp. 1_MG-2023]MDO6439759.1 FISUMP domain-containing protein [Cyclobacterium sp. 1_MG-2023]
MKANIEIKVGDNKYYKQLILLKLGSNVVLLFTFCFFSCSVFDEPPNSSDYGQVYDIDGNKYLTIEIGNQIWMAENLKTTSFSNGDPIQEIKKDSEWGRALNEPEVIKPAWSYYENNISFNEDNGKLYNWYAIADNRNCCPDGWRIPTKSDFETMLSSLGDKKKAIRSIKKEGDIWPKSDKANNNSGFSAFPSGYRNNGGNFFDFGKVACFWTSDSFIGSYSRSVKEGFFTSENLDDYVFNGYSKEYGLGVRCIKE